MSKKANTLYVVAWQHPLMSVSKCGRLIAGVFQCKYVAEDLAFKFRSQFKECQFEVVEFDGIEK